MAFFEDLKRGLTVTGQTVAQKTKEIGETVQVKAAISAEKDNIAKLFAAIGQQVFEEETEIDAERFCTEFGSIKESLDKIEELEAQLSEKDGCIFCAECGARIEKNSAFCSKCGAKVEKKNVADFFKKKAEAAGEAIEEAKDAAEDIFEEVEDKVEDIVDDVKEKIEDVVD